MLERDIAGVRAKKEHMTSVGEGYRWCKRKEGYDQCWRGISLVLEERRRI